MKILLAVEDLGIGGAQTFVLRLAQALHLGGHEVHIYNHYTHLVNKKLVQQLAPGVSIISYGSDTPRQDNLLRKAAGLGRRLGRPDWLRENRVIIHLRQTIQRLKPDVVNSHTIKADYISAKALEGLNIPLVITMHGCYELFLHRVDAPEVTPKGNYALQHAAAVVYLSNKNLEIFKRPGIRPLESVINQKIYNGFERDLMYGDYNTRATLGIPAEAKVFGMVGRGIPEKGWVHAIHSFLHLEAEHPELHLILVGDSKYLRQLQTQHSHPRLHFTGFCYNPIIFVDTFDVGLLPSYFHAESLPNSIAEYLSCGKPVIASRIGEIPAMLESEQGPVGVVLDQANWELTDPNQLTEAMRAYLTQPSLLAEHQRRATLILEKFSMKTCMAAYEELFEQVSCPAKDKWSSST